jgi:hypothetical protein
LFFGLVHDAVRAEVWTILAFTSLSVGRLEHRSFPEVVVLLSLPGVAPLHEFEVLLLPAANKSVTIIALDLPDLQA